MTTSSATANATARILAQHRHPDRDPWFIDAVMGKWWQKYQDEGNLERPMALPDSRIRASWAGKCARQVAYGIAGVEPTNPATVASAWNFVLGTMIHELVQEAIIDAFPGSEAEVVTKIGDIGSGHGDLLVIVSKGQLPQFPDGARIAVEMKSIGGSGFKIMTHPNSGEGAKAEAIMQGALNAASMDPPPDFLLIPYFSKENIGVEMAATRGIRNEIHRFAAQWTFTRDEYEKIARDEMERLARIVHRVDTKGPASVARIVPDPNLPPHIITNPRKGTMRIIQDDEGGPRTKGLSYYWGCSYCDYQEQCDRDG